jgi:hypothetical protein
MTPREKLRQKPFSQACANNRDVILEVLLAELHGRKRVLEIGSGTGQHAVFIGGSLAPLEWQTSDRLVNHEGILAWLEYDGPPNVLPPFDLDVAKGPWPSGFDAVFSANTAHIMGELEVVAMFEGVGALLPVEGVFALYGPFIDATRVTAPSNVRFDQMLRERDPASGLRGREDLEGLAVGQGLRLRADHEMPANNRVLVWEKC